MENLRELVQEEQRDADSIALTFERGHTSVFRTSASGSITSASVASPPEVLVLLQLPNRAAFNAAGNLMQCLGDTTRPAAAFAYPTHMLPMFPVLRG